MLQICRDWRIRAGALLVRAGALLVLVALIAGATADAAPQGPRDGPVQAAVFAGRDSFNRFCSPCHGIEARGGGPIAPMLMAPPTDLRGLARRNNGVFPLDYLEELFEATGRVTTTAHGSSQMPIWGLVFLGVDESAAAARSRAANLILYLESIQDRVR